MMEGLHLTNFLLGRTCGHTYDVAFVCASNIKADGFRKLGSLTSPVSPISLAFKHTTFPSFNFDSLGMQRSAFLIALFSLFAFRQFFLCFISRRIG